MSTEEIVLAAILLDLLMGDPRWLPHPVNSIAALAQKLETVFRGMIASRFWAGTLASLGVYFVSFALPWGLIRGAHSLDPRAGDALSVFFIYTCIAFRDLLGHSVAVSRELKAQRLEGARVKVALMVGRDTGNLPEGEVVRATVESVAESLVDGVTAPLFFAVFLGAPWAVLYKAINTLDSLFGHKDERYLNFGKFPARMDDVTNWIPARITAPLVAVGAVFVALNPWQSLRILFRDGGKHASPNSGLPEAAFAGAMGVQLGGENSYDGVKVDKPRIGDSDKRLAPSHIVIANRLLAATSLVTVLVYLGLRRIFLQ
jgi:adenosylcobinamide-phosphate synthase